jgi:hypothetical protein
MKVYIVNVGMPSKHDQNIGIAETPELAARKVEEIVGHQLQWSSKWRCLTPMAGIASITIEEWEIGGSWFTDFLPEMMKEAMEQEEAIQNDPTLRWLFGKGDN